MKTGIRVSPGQRAILAAARLVLTLRHPLLIRRFMRKTGYLPNPAAPVRYHERMLWRKIVDHDPLFVTLSDKLAAKDYISAVCPEVKSPRTLWAGTDPEDIPPELLAGDVVVKTNHGCEMNIFVSGGKPDRATIVRATKGWLKSRYGISQHEWAYWSIVPKVFVEELLPLAGGEIATEIKVQVCSGVVCHVRAEDKKALRSRLFDPEGNPLPGRDVDYPREDQALEITPRLLDYIRQAAALAPRIAGDLDYARIDFLVTDKELYAGEITLYTGGGYSVWSNPAIMADIERNWRLDQAKFLQRKHRGIARLYADALRAKCLVEAGQRAPTPIEGRQSGISDAMDPTVPDVVPQATLPG
ncbi:ATP-grasp fold amidoligase family protein [Mesorhizobium comanense]|uniref:ATP-grasp fold amidoligase family protein n=1 Tax=Mesorhizobium comanense TaxID=2502215 RepID=UPI001484C84B|nr:ATP-grasp fold amidoligase family protein [Mesorhizobium comanense]